MSEHEHIALDSQGGCALGEVTASAVSGSLRPGPRCDGCNRNWYSAPGGQRGRPQPHSWCLDFGLVPMRMGPHEKWLASEIPLECPIHGKGRLRG